MLSTGFDRSKQQVDNSLDDRQGVFVCLRIVIRGLTGKLQNKNTRLPFPIMKFKGPSP
jgi:hypothetical protein